MKLLKILKYKDMIKDTEDKIPDLTNVVTNAALNTKIKEVKGEIVHFTNLATNTSLNTKIIKEVKGEILNITNLASYTSLTNIENKIPNVSNLVKKLTIAQNLVKLKKRITDHNYDKYITTPEIYYY